MWPSFSVRRRGNNNGCIAIFQRRQLNKSDSLLSHCCSLIWASASKHNDVSKTQLAQNRTAHPGPWWRTVQMGCRPSCHGWGWRTFVFQEDLHTCIHSWHILMRDTCVIPDMLLWDVSGCQIGNKPFLQRSRALNGKCIEVHSIISTWLLDGRCFTCSVVWRLDVLCCFHLWTTTNYLWSE